MSDIKTEYKYDASTDTVVHAHTQDTDAILAANKAERDGFQQNFLGEAGRKVASIPTLLLHQWGKEDGVDYFKSLRNPDAAMKLMRRLNSNEFQKLRTHESRLAASDFTGLR